MTGLRPRTPVERLLAGLVAGCASLPLPLKRLLAGPPIRRDGLELDLDTQLVVRFAELHPRPPLQTRTPSEARADLRAAVTLLAGGPAAGVESSELELAGAAGPRRARLYRPSGADGALPAVLFFHGGGWVVGDLDTHDRPCRALARSSGAAVVSFDYRLAPEHPFPAPVDDALAAFFALAERAGELGLDGRIALAGDSAGGHLAAVTAQQTARLGGPAPAFQLLIYPATDFSRRAPSRTEFGEGFLLTRENMDWYEEQFLPPGTDVLDPRVSPLLADSLAGVAPAMVVTAGFDPLRDEGEAYAGLLRQSGVWTLARRYPGYVHGFVNMAAASRGFALALAEMGGVLRAAFGA